MSPGYPFPGFHLGRPGPPWVPLASKKEKIGSTFKERRVEETQAAQEAPRGPRKSQEDPAVSGGARSICEFSLGQPVVPVLGYLKHLYPEKNGRKKRAGKTKLPEQKRPEKRAEKKEKLLGNLLEKKTTAGKNGPEKTAEKKGGRPTKLLLQMAETEERNSLSEGLTLF